MLTTELVGPSKRGLVSTGPSLVFSIGVVVLSLTAWLTQNWRTMTALLALFGLVVVTPFVYWYDYFIISIIFIYYIH